MGPVSIAILTPKSPLTDHHKKVIGDEVRAALKSAESVSLHLPLIGEGPAPSYIRSLCRDPKYSSRLSIAITYFDRHYPTAALVSLAQATDIIIACPSRMSCGRIVDRVWGPTKELQRAGRYVHVAYPKDIFK